MKPSVEIKAQIERMEKQAEQLFELSRLKGANLMELVRAKAVLDEKIKKLKWILNE